MNAVLRVASGVFGGFCIFIICLIATYLQKLTWTDYVILSGGTLMSLAFFIMLYHGGKQKGDRIVLFIFGELFSFGAFLVFLGSSLHAATDGEFLLGLTFVSFVFFCGLSFQMYKTLRKRSRYPLTPKHERG